MKLCRKYPCMAWLWASVFLPVLSQAQISDRTISSKGTAFWGAFLENIDLSMNDSPNFAFQIEAVHDVTGSIQLIGTGLTVPFTVAGGTVANIDMPESIFYPQGSESISDFGILITADDSIEVTALHWRTYFSETSALLPTGSLGSHYLAQCYRRQDQDKSAFIIVATEDNTAITILPTAVTLQGRPAGQSFTVQLNRGQTFQVQSLQDLVGTDIQSTGGKPIAVFGGAKTTQVECDAASSHLYDQCLPLDRNWFWGHRFFIVPFYGQSSSAFRVVAAESDTRVQIDCNTVATLQQGQSWTGNIGTPGMLYADKLVSVSQMARGVICSGVWQNGDPMLVNLLPEGVYSQYAAIRVPKRTSTGLAFSSNTLTIIAKAGQTDNIQLDGVSLNNYPHTQLGTQWEFTRVFLLPDSTYHLRGDNAPFQAYLHGLAYANAYSNWVSFDRKEMDTTSDVALLAPDTVCIDSAFTITVTSGALQWLELHLAGDRQQLQPDLPLTIGQPGTAIFAAAVQVAGECQPQLIYAQTVATACPPPPDTCGLYIPNVFTPNGDQLNDLFGALPAACGFSEYHFSIYNRWGQFVFSSSQPYAGWNGKMPGGEDAQMDVYIWVLAYRRYPGADLIQRTGDVTVLR